MRLSSCFFFFFLSHSSLSFQESPVMILIRTIQMEINFPQSKRYVYEPFILCNILTCRLPRLPLSPPLLQILSLNWVLRSSSTLPLLSTETDKSCFVFILSTPWDELKAALFSGRSLFTELLADAVLVHKITFLIKPLKWPFNFPYILSEYILHRC